MEASVTIQSRGLRSPQAARESAEAAAPGVTVPSTTEPLQASSEKETAALRRKLLPYIEKHSRAGVEELAVMFGAEEAQVADELAALEAEGIICGYHTMIDWSKTQIEEVSALIEVKVTPQRGLGFDSIAERIYQYPEVRSVYLMSGGFDLMVIVEGKSLQEVAGFVSNKLSTMESILSTATHFILKKYKDHGTVLVKREGDARELVSP